MSKEFIESQIAYYARNLRCGPTRDWNQICGLLHYYEAEFRKISAK